MRVAVLSAFVGIIVAVAGCTSSGDGSAELLATMTQGLSSSSVASVTVQVSGPGISSPITYNLVVTNGSWSGTIHAIPAGTGRSFHADARDATNAIVYSGTVGNVTITKGSTAVVAMLLQQVNAPPPFMNDVPQIDSLVASNNTAGVGDSIDVQVAAHDPDAGDTLQYAWSATGGTFANPSAAATSWTAPTTQGVQTLTIQVTDAKGSTAAMSFSVMVDAGRGEANVSTTFNTWPQVVGLVASPTRIDVGQTTALTLSAVDNDGDPLQYAWTATCSGSFDNASAASPHFTLSALPGTGSCALVVTVTDGRGGMTTGTIGIQTGPGATTNYAPVVDSAFQSLTTANGGDQVTFAVNAHDPDGTAVTIAWSANVGTLGTPNVTGPGASNVVWTAPACFPQGTTPTVAATITDGTGVSTTYGFAITPASGSVCGFRIGGTVTGLASSIVLANGSEQLTVSANGTFQFANKANAYNVTIAAQPSSPAQTCTVTNGSGTATADVTTVQVDCPPFVVAGGLDHPSTLTRNGSTLYFARGLPPTVTDCYSPTGSGDAVMFVPASGSAAPTKIADIDHSAGNCGVYGLVFDASYVYWANYADGVIKKANLDGTNVGTVFSGPTYLNSLQIDPAGGFLYYFAYASYAIRRVATTGGTAATFTNISSTNGINSTVDASYLYWTDASAGTVNRLAFATSPLPGMPTVLASGETSAVAPFVTASAMYWLDSGATGTLRTVPLTGGTATTLAAGLPSPSSIVVDASYAYVLASGTAANNYADGVIYKVPVTGGTAVVVAKNLYQPGTLLMDAGHLYWTNGSTSGHSDGSITMIAK